MCLGSRSIQKLSCCLFLEHFARQNLKSIKGTEGSAGKENFYCLYISEKKYLKYYYISQETRWAVVIALKCIQNVFKALKNSYEAEFWKYKIILEVFCIKTSTM